MNFPDYLLSSFSKKVLRLAEQIALEHKHNNYSSAHILWALADEDIDTFSILKELGRDPQEIRRWTFSIIEKFPKANRTIPHPGPDLLAIEMLKESQKLCLRYGQEEILPIDLLESACTPNVGFSSDIIRKLPIALYEILDWRNANPSSNGQLIRNNQSQASNTSSNNPISVQNHAQILEKYCDNISLRAQEGKIDPLIGRDKELKQLMEILGKRLSPNVLILGEPGVGKTALLGGLAQNIITGKVPERLQGVTIFELDINGRLIAGAFKGEVEERLKSVIDAIKSYEQKAILFIDEVHILLDDKGSVGSGVVNLLKPELARGEITLIGATTQAEYQKFIEKDPAFNRRFSKLTVNEPEIPLAIEMITGLVYKYEEYHQFNIDAEAINQSVKLSKRYIGDKHLPTSAIELIDFTMSCASQMNSSSSAIIEDIESDWLNGEKKETKRIITQLKNKLSELLLGKLSDDLSKEEVNIEEVFEKLKNWVKEKKININSEDIEAIVSYKLSIPIGKLRSKEQDKFASMDEILKKRVIGQDHVIESVSRGLKTFRTNLKDPKDPGAIFFPTGPTGTGKTELAKSIAELLFDDENAMIRFDMSEFQESHSVAALIGSPPGYVGFEEGGLLVNKIRKQPYSVLLFDEIEKAHPDIYGIFLQMLTDSRLQDKQGKMADFSNTIIIFTSNAGAEGIIESFNKGIIPQPETLKQLLRETRKFKDEFLGRVDSQILPFSPITNDAAISILKVHLNKFKNILKQQHQVNLSYSDNLITYLVEIGFSPLYGARPLKNTIKTYLTPVLADQLIDGKIKPHDTIILDVNEQKEIIVQHQL